MKPHIASIETTEGTKFVLFKVMIWAMFRILAEAERQMLLVAKLSWVQSGTSACPFTE